MSLMLHIQTSNLQHTNNIFKSSLTISSFQVYPTEDETVSTVMLDYVNYMVQYPPRSSTEWCNPTEAALII